MSARRTGLSRLWRYTEGRHLRLSVVLLLGQISSDAICKDRHLRTNLDSRLEVFPLVTMSANAAIARTHPDDAVADIKRCGARDAAGVHHHRHLARKRWKALADVSRRRGFGVLGFVELPKIADRRRR